LRSSFRQGHILHSPANSFLIFKGELRHAQTRSEHLGIKISADGVTAIGAALVIVLVALAAYRF